MDRTPRPLVWINGWPAVGKQTVGQCLIQILGQDRAVLIDDYEFTDHLELPAEGGRARANSVNRTRACSSSCGGSSVVVEEESPTVEERQTACFRKHVEDAQSLGRVVVFTDCSADSVAGEASARVYEAAARRAGRPFAPVYMECSIETNVRRTQTWQRRCGQAAAANKLCSPAALRALRAQTDDRLFRFPAHEWQGLCVDVTDQGAHDSAMQILAFVNEVGDRHSVALAREAEKKNK